MHAHHDTTGREIADDLGHVDLLFGGLGTTGPTRGAVTLLRAANPRLQTIGIGSTKEDFIGPRWPRAPWPTRKKRRPQYIGRLDTP